MKKLFFTYFLQFLFVAAFAQEEEVKVYGPKPDWKELKSGLVRGYLYSELPDQMWRFYTSQRDEYPYENLFDNNKNTTWAGALPSNGVGEYLVFEIRPPNESTAITIFPGYTKSESLFKANSRPKDMKIYLMRTKCHDCTPSYCEATNFKVVNTTSVTLADQFGYQSIPVPHDIYSEIEFIEDCSIRWPDKPFRYYLAIEILSVYPGNKYRDLCISGIVIDFTH